MPFVIYLWFDPAKNASDELKRTIWEQISDDWIMFKVNVTTDESIFEAKSVRERIKCRFTTYFANGGGSYDPETGARSAVVNLKQDPLADNGKSYLFRTPSHEIGHTFDLMHDTDNLPYYGGHGEYGAIMGGGGGPVTQWSKGEYEKAGNPEDDIAIIGAVLGFVDDDKPEAVNLVIENDGTVLEEKNNGTITSREEVDEFKIVVESNATVNITADPSILYPNLDIGIALKDSDGNVMANDAPVGKRSATISAAISTPGIYTVEVDGVGELTPSTGWSDYASLGYYQLSGSVEGGVTGNNLPGAVDKIDKTISLYHSSANNMVFIDGFSNYKTIQLMSVNGATVKTFEKTNRINLSKVTPGKYILVFKSDDVVVKSKLLTIK